MKKKALAITIGLALLSAATASLAEGNTQAGKAKSATCAGCHGEDGNSLAAMFPKLAGQHASYTARQLKAFKDGTRNNPTMMPMAAALSDDDIADLSAYYAAQKIAPNENAPPTFEDDDETVNNVEETPELSTKELVALGRRLYETGNVDSGVSACIACHGPTGMGNKPAGFPVLKGQHAEYVYTALKEFQAGARGGDFSKMMYMVAQKMTRQEMKAAAAYISTIK
ncbi:MAG: c-type cytochrome [Pseudomonadota bacterium]